MKHTAILAFSAGVGVITTFSHVDAQTEIRIPRILNQKTLVMAPRIITFAYVSTPSLRAQVRDAYLARIAKKNPSRAKMLSADFARNDPDRFYQSLIANTGLQNYDVADTLTAYNLTGWIIANGVKTMPPRSQILAARRQTATVLAKDPRMASATVRAKTAEDIKLSIVALHFGLVAARRSGDTKAYADEVAALFAETGANPRTLTLSNTGFVRRR